MWKRNGYRWAVIFVVVVVLIVPFSTAAQPAEINRGAMNGDGVPDGKEVMLKIYKLEIENKEDMGTTPWDENNLPPANYMDSDPLKPRYRRRRPFRRI